AALQKGEMPFGDVKHLIFALQAVNARDAVPTLVNLLKSEKVKKEQETDLHALLAGVGGAPELTMVFDKALAKEGSNPDRRKLLEALEHAARQRQVKPAGDLMRVESLLKSKDNTTRIVAAKLIGAWKLERLTTQLHDLVNEPPPLNVKQSPEHPPLNVI